MSRHQPKMSKRTLEQWLSEYSVSHQNLVNKKIHWLCVPTIFVSLLGMGMSLSMFILICLSVMAAMPWGFKAWAAVFIVAWIGQFIGHKIEGKKPSFFKDLQFLMIGPAWVADSLMQRK